ncbi:hypothetical protein GGR54DRAFT_606685 [Hypoxylon sp. NC1633]|nr:hypothetical protein GGR54DRAFT_606685 [Hypoxylon sp. NC1633]
MSATPKPWVEDDTSQSPPPTYGEAVDETTTQPTPHPAGNGQIFNGNPMKKSIRITIRAKPKKDRHHQPWIAQMDVKCDNVPLLMREGFYWTKANIIQEEGFIENVRPKIAHLLQIKNPCTVSRFWFLQDLQQPPRWVASLQIHAPNYEVLSRIRFETWTTDMIRFVEAWGATNRLIYFYDALDPEWCINSIYDDILLKRWWAKPKKPKIDRLRKRIRFNFHWLHESGTGIQVGCGLVWRR